MPPASVRWRTPSPEEWRFCPLCRADLVWRELDGSARRVCPECGFVFWAHPRPAAAAVVDDGEGRVLCVRRRYPPEPGGWCLPGGFAEEGETAEQAACRETREETGVEVDAVRQLGVGGRFIVFVQARPVGGRLAAGPDALEAAWFPAAAAPELCFPSHRDALAAWRRGAR